MKDDVTLSDKAKRPTAGGDSIPAFGPWLTNYNHAFERWAQSGGGVTGRAADIYMELMAFWQSRFQADIDAWKAFASCRNLGDFFECQKQFAQTAVTDYCDEASKFTSRITDVIGSASSPFRQEQR